MSILVYKHVQSRPSFLLVTAASTLGITRALLFWLAVALLQPVDY